MTVEQGIGHYLTVGEPMDSSSAMLEMLGNWAFLCFCRWGH